MEQEITQRKQVDGYLQYNIKQKSVTIVAYDLET